MKDRFIAYFDRDVAQRAAKSLSNGVEIEIRIQDSPDAAPAEVYTFTRVGGKNKILESAAKSPQLIFTLARKAAEEILSDTSDDIGTIGVNIVKMMARQDPELKVSMKIEAGFLSLYSKGFLGVITAGGSGFASYLASRGMNGMSAIKAVLKKKGD